MLPRNQLITYFFAANFNTVLPLSYYNRLADRLGPIEGAPTYGDSTGVFFNPDIVNPSSFNRQNGWPITVRSNMRKEEQVWWYFQNKLITKLKVQKCSAGGDYWSDQFSNGKIPMAVNRDCKLFKGNLWQTCFAIHIYAMHWYLCFQISLDKQLGCTWHVVAGEEFGFDLDYEVSIGVIPDDISCFL